jgi:hypothetical protein
MNDSQFNEALKRWRQQTRPLWKKHHRAGKLMMRFFYRQGSKAKRRANKWIRVYERTLNRIPLPPETSF